MANKAGINRYSANWEKLSRRLRIYHPCFFCGLDEYNNKECHHIDEDKKNSELSNIIVLCIDCHIKVHKKEVVIPEDFKGYKLISVSKITSNKY